MEYTYHNEEDGRLVTYRTDIVENTLTITENLDGELNVMTLPLHELAPIFLSLSMNLNFTQIA